MLRVPCFPVFDVTDWLITQLEPGGDDPKFWLLGAANEPEEQSWLFKQVTRKQVPVARRQGGGLREYQQGEDWVEKIASELAALIGMPAARVELATRDGVPGLISRDTRPSGWSLHGAGVRIAEIDDRYRPKTDSDPRLNRIGHNLDNVQVILEQAHAAPGWSEASRFSAFDLLAGYFLFDAWIANRDRHESNWALLQDPDGAVYLSPSFDHGAALGSGLEDPNRDRLVVEGRVESWCERGTAWRFEDSQDVTLVDHARNALDRSSAEARTHWLTNLTDVAAHQWETVLDRIPSLSVEARNFTCEVLRINQERIRHEFVRVR